VLRDQSLSADLADASLDSGAALSIEDALHRPAIFLVAAFLHLGMGHLALMPGND
jgi:hypothetical protein